MKLRDGEAGKYAALVAGDLTAFITDREKALELASLQEWAESV